MAKLTLTNLTSLTNEESAIAAINANNDATEAALELTLSRNGATPNSMSANLDMNGFRILNMAAPVNDNDPVRLIDVIDGIQGDQGIPGNDGAPGGPITDGDYGDIVASSNGTVLTIDDDVISTPARAVLAATSLSNMRDELELGGAAILNTGTIAGTVVLGDDSRFSDHIITTKNVNSSFTLAERFVYHSSGSAHGFTIDAAATTPYPLGRQIIVNNDITGGDITITRAIGVNLYVNGATSSTGATIAAGGIGTLIHRTTNNWLLIGANIS